MRDDDGRLRLVQASGRTATAAEHALKLKITRRGTYSAREGELSPGTPFPALVLPAFEHFTLREITISKVDRFLKAHAKISYSRAKLSKVDADRGSPGRNGMASYDRVAQGKPTSRQDHPKTSKTTLIGLAQQEPEHLIFFSRNHTPLTTSNVRRRLRTILDEAGIDGVTPHSFRRTVATVLGRAAEPISPSSNLADRTGAGSRGPFDCPRPTVPKFF